MHKSNSGPEFILQLPLDFTHLDPSCDPPEAYREAFELFGEIWGGLRAFRAARANDDILRQLMQHLENQTLAAGVILSVQIERLAGIENERPAST
jgi:hypothetical protein